MTISIISSFTFNHDFANAHPSGEPSVTANAGDIILFQSAHDYTTSSASGWTGVTWGTATFVPLASYTDIYRQEYWWVKADVSGTFPINRTCVDYVRGSTSVTVLRSSTNSFATVPVTILARSFVTTTPTPPSLNFTLTSSQIALNILSAGITDINWTTIEPNTWTAGGLGTTSVTTGDTANVLRFRTWISQTVGAGSHTTTYTPSVTVAKNNFVSIAFTETTSFITSIDTDDIVEVGQAINIVTTGFSALPVATNSSGIAITLNGGSNNLWTGSVATRVNGSPFPSLPVVTGLTLTNGTQTDTRNVTIIRPSTEQEVTFATPIINDNTYVSWHLNNAGYTVDGGTLYFTPYSNLTIGTDGGLSVNLAGAINGWWRPSQGIGMGNVYQVTFNISSTGAVTSIDITTLLANSTSPKYDALFPLGNRP